MSDYLYMLESHLNPDQNRVVAEVQAAAAEAGMNLFLTGGAIRDMLAGYRIRDLDFVVEGNALKVAKAICDRTGAAMISSDDLRKSAELRFSSGVTAQIAMSHRARYARPGSRPQITPATIQDDLRGRDFCCNAIAVSLNKASRGLLLDPTNGLADIERHELRSVSAYGFYDDPSRLLRLARFQVRLEYTVEARTRMQVDNAREADVAKSIPARILGEELHAIAAEDKPAEIFQALGEYGLAALFSPASAGEKLNIVGIAKLEKLFRLVPEENLPRDVRFGPFVYALTEKLTPKEKSALISATEMNRTDANGWQKLEARSKKLESALRSARIRKASQVYHLVSAAEPDQVVFLMYHSALKPVQERLRNHFQKYLPAIGEITPEEWAAVEGKPGTPRYDKARREFVSHRLDRRPPRKVEPPRELPPPPPPPARPPVEVGMLRRGR